MVKTLCIIQARLTSMRLPNKVMMPLGSSGKSILEHVYERLSISKQINKIVFAIPDSSSNDELAQFICNKGFDCTRGSEEDVLDRFYQCAIKYAPKIVVRATCDNPLVDYCITDDLIENLDKYDYMSCKGIPLGSGVEVFTMSALSKTHNEATTIPEHEHVTPYIYTHPDKFRINHKNYNLPTYRLTVDEENDYELMNRIYDELYHGFPIANEKIYSYLAQHVDLVSLNTGVHQKRLNE